MRARRILTDAGLVWNRACSYEATGLREGGARSAALLLVDGYIQDGGVCHAFDLTPDELAAGLAGYAFFGLDELAAIVKPHGGDGEADHNRRYYAWSKTPLSDRGEFNEMFGAIPDVRALGARVGSASADGIPRRRGTCGPTRNRGRAEGTTPRGSQFPSSRPSGSPPSILLPPAPPAGGHGAEGVRTEPPRRSRGLDGRGASADRVPPAGPAECGRPSGEAGRRRLSGTVPPVGHALERPPASLPPPPHPARPAAAAARTLAARARTS